MLDFAALAETERLEIHVYQLNEDAPAEEYDEEVSTTVSWAEQWSGRLRSSDCRCAHAASPPFPSRFLISQEDTSSALQWLLPCRTLRCEE